MITIAMVSAANLAACGALHPVAIVNENGTPLTNALVVHGQILYPISPGWLYIQQSDSNGVVYLSDRTRTFTAGCRGYFPVTCFTHTCSTGKLDVIIQKVVLSVSNKEEYMCCFPEYEYLRTGKTRRHFEESPLWKEWGDYLIELEGKGYFEPNFTIMSTNRYF